MATAAAKEEVKEFAFEDWLSEGIKGMRSRYRRKKEKHSAFWEHIRAARKEMLLAARSVIDAAIERLEEQPKEKKKATKINVE